jgi:hypothetical protein
MLNHQLELLLDFDYSVHERNQESDLPSFLEPSLYSGLDQYLFEMHSSITNHLGDPSTIIEGDETTSFDLASENNEADQIEPLHNREEEADDYRPQELSEILFLSYRYMDRILSKPERLVHLSKVWSEPIKLMLNHYLKLESSATPIEMMRSIEKLLNKSMRLDEQLRHVYMRFTSYLLDKVDCCDQEKDIHLTSNKNMLKKDRLQKCYESQLFKIPREISAKISDCQNGFSITKLQTIKDFSPKLFHEFVIYLNYQYELDDEKWFDQYFSNMSRSYISKEKRQMPRNPCAVRKTKEAVIELIKKKLK